MPNRKIGAQAKLLMNLRDLSNHPNVMNISVEMITDAALSLSCDARALLADRLSENLDPLVDIEVGAA